MHFLHCTLQFWPRVTYTLLALYTLQFWPRVTVTYALLLLYPSILTKSHLCLSCTIPFNFDQKSPCISCSIPFSFDQESLMPFLHYTLQFWPKSHLCLSCTIYPSILTKSHLAFLVVYPSVLTKSHLCPFHSIPFLLFFKVLSNWERADLITKSLPFPSQAWYSKVIKKLCILF